MVADDTWETYSDWEFSIVHLGKKDTFYHWERLLKPEFYSEKYHRLSSAKANSSVIIAVTLLN